MSETRSSISAEVVDGFRDMPAAFVGDILGGLGLRCVPEGLRPLAPGMKLCGPAVTMRYITARDAADHARHQDVRELCRPGDVMVVEMGGRLDGGVLGAKGVIDAINRGMNGIVVDGGVRESEAIIAAGFPAFTRGVTMHHTHGHLFGTCINNGPIQVGAIPSSVMVEPGDLILGENDGIVVVPADRAEQVLAMSRRYMELDGEIKAKLRAGKPSKDPEIVPLTKELLQLLG